MAIQYGPWGFKLEKLRNLTRYSVLRFKQMPDGTKTKDRLPIKQYLTIRDNPEELQKLCDRLNYDYNKVKLAKQKVKFKHAFIDDELIEDFRALLSAQIPSKDRVSTNIHYLKTHFLNFFIAHLGLANPTEWYEVHQTKWAHYLTGPKAPAAPATKREVIQIANRFMVWMHGKRPHEIPLIKFSPLSAAVMKKLEAERKMNKEGANRMSIADEHWAKIKKKLPDSIKGAALIAYHYGLRRSEILGLNMTDVKKGYLWVERQLLEIRPALKFGPPKGREPRKVPHWFCTPIQTHKWIVEMTENIIHPDTLSHRWKELMEELKLDYDFHDLRHTFTTKAIGLHNAKEVMHACGHKDIATTMGYIHDDRAMDDEQFNPDEVA